MLQGLFQGMNFMLFSMQANKLIRRALCLAAVGMTLSACTSASLQQNTRPIAWDGTGRDPNLPDVRQRSHSLAATTLKRDPIAEEDALLASLEPKSPEWFSAQRKIEADRDNRLAAKLVICRGCSVSGTKAEPSQAAGPTDSRLSALR